MFYNNYDREEKIKMNKNFFSDNRYNEYVLRFVSEDRVKSGKYIQEKDFFPVTTYKEIINERVEMTPTEFSITGKEKDFLKKNFLEDGNINSKLPSLFLEQELSGDAFWKIKVKESDNKDLLYEFEFELLNSEEMIVVIDTYTMKPIRFIYEYYLEVQNDDGSYTNTKFKETYDKDKITIKTEIPSMSVLRKFDTKERVIDNPFKEYGMMPILWFRGYRENGSIYSQIPASSLIEPTLQLDYSNTDKENLKHRHAFPITEVLKSMKKYGDIDLGAGTIWYSRGDEALKIHQFDLKLTELNEDISHKIDSTYKVGGLVPPSTREPMFSSSSSKMAKYASKEFVELTKTRLENIRIELKKIIKLFLELNGKKYTDEEISIPSDILSIDREELLKNISIELSLGLIDDVYVWNKYYPDMTDEERKRIQEFRKENMIDQNDDNLNIDNNIKAGSITGNKEANKMSTDDKESVTTKEK